MVEAVVASILGLPRMRSLAWAWVAIPLALLAILAAATERAASVHVLQLWTAAVGVYFYFLGWVTIVVLRRQDA